MVITTGCSTLHYRKSADKEVYGIIHEKSAEVAGMEQAFSIDQDAKANPLAEMKQVQTNDPALGPAVGEEVGCAVLALEDAVTLAVKRNRSYQSKKEAVYLQALALTQDRHRYTPIGSGKASGNYNRSTRDVTVPSDFTQALTAAQNSVQELEALTGTPAALIQQYQAVVASAGTVAGLDKPRVVTLDERSVNGDVSAGVQLLLKGGGRLAAGITSNFLRFLTGQGRPDAASVVTASLTQPLLAGAGRDVAAEQLTQAERDVLYALREFTQYRKQFAVEVCSAYYGVLQQRDVMRNTWQGLQNFRKNLEREQAFAAEGLRTQAELGRMKQNEIDNENRYTNAVRRYQQILDQFKIQLGLSTDVRILLDDNELKSLREQGLLHPDINTEDAIKVAVVSRLDYQNDLDAADDAARKVHVAENALKPRLDLVAGAKVISQEPNRAADLDFKRMTWNVGLQVDPIFDRKALRNAYRSSLIAYESSLRQKSLAEDNIKLQLRDSWRNLEQAYQNYESAEQSVKLGQRRVEEQNLLAELGQATAKDQVDAQNDLITSQNSLTAALVGHTIARLSFWRDMGLLYIKENGLWKELKYGNSQPAIAAQQ